MIKLDARVSVARARADCVAAAAGVADDDISAFPQESQRQSLFHWRGNKLMAVRYKQFKVRRMAVPKADLPFQKRSYFSGGDILAILGFLAKGVFSPKFCHANRIIHEVPAHY